MSVTAKLRPIFLLLLAACGLSSCDSSQRSSNVRMTIVVEAGEQIHIGTGVQEFSCRDGIKWAGSMDIGGCSVRGEAIPVNLGLHGVIFVTLKRNNALDEFPEATLRSIGYNNIPDNPEILPIRRASERTYPMIVQFTDINDMNSAAIFHSGDKSFQSGEEIHIRAVALEFTRDKITRGQLQKSLPWMAAILKSGPRLSDNKLNANISTADLSR